VKNWKPILISFVITIAIGGIYLFTVWRHRQEPGASRNQPAEPVKPDDLAVVRMEFPQHFDDVKDLEGKSVWMKNAIRCRTIRTPAGASSGSSLRA